MAILKTTRLNQQNKKYEIEIPSECIKKLGWRNGHILEVDVENSEIIIKKLQGFVGA